MANPPKGKVSNSPVLPAFLLSQKLCSLLQEGRIYLGRLCVCVAHIVTFQIANYYVASFNFKVFRQFHFLKDAIFAGAEKKYTITKNSS